MLKTIEKHVDKFIVDKEENFILQAHKVLHNYFHFVHELSEEGEAHLAKVKREEIAPPTITVSEDVEQDGVFTVVIESYRTFEDTFDLTLLHDRKVAADLVEHIIKKY